MPIFEAELEVSCPPDRAFDFLVRPANLLLVSPPEFKLKLVEAPERLSLGARFTFQGSKFGVPQKITNQVTAFEDGVGFTDVQVSGPFKKLEHTHRLEQTANGTRMIDRVDFEAPGGVVGLFLTNNKIRQYLESLNAYRAKRFKELLI